MQEKTTRFWWLMTTLCACARCWNVISPNKALFSVANAEQMDRLLTRESFHLMVLDLMLPGKMACRFADVFVARVTRCRSLW